MGNWADILEDPDYKDKVSKPISLHWAKLSQVVSCYAMQLKRRTNVNLKDKFRNMMKARTEI